MENIIWSYYTYHEIYSYEKFQILRYDKYDGGVTAICDYLLKYVW